MDELKGTRAFAERSQPDAAVTQGQFIDLVKRAVAEINVLRHDVAGLHRRIEELEIKRGRP